MTVTDDDADKLRIGIAESAMLLTMLRADVNSKRTWNVTFNSHSLITYNTAATLY